MAAKEVIYFPFGVQLHALQTFQTPWKGPAAKVVGGVGR